MTAQPLRERGQPRRTVLVVQGDAGGHLGDIGLRVEVVRVRVRDLQTLGEAAPTVVLQPETPMTTTSAAGSGACWGEFVIECSMC